MEAIHPRVKGQIVLAGEGKEGRKDTKWNGYGRADGSGRSQREVNMIKIHYEVLRELKNRKNTVRIQVLSR